MSEPFKVGMSVKWHQGAEMGSSITFGEIVEVIGPERFGTLMCKFPDDRLVEFKKLDGRAVAESGYIRL